MALAVYESGVVGVTNEVVDVEKDDEEVEAKKLGEEEGDVDGLVGRLGCTNFKMRLRVA